MMLKSIIDLVEHDRVLGYAFDPATGSHHVQVWDASSWDCGALISEVLRSPGAAINYLVPFRGNSDVDELIAWLAR